MANILLFFLVLLASCLSIISDMNSVKKTCSLCFIVVSYILIMIFNTFNMLNANREKEDLLKSIGYTTYTKEELYEMSEKEKSQLLHTQSTIDGIKYWKIDEQDTK